MKSVKIWCGALLCLCLAGCTKTISETGDGTAAADERLTRMEVVTTPLSGQTETQVCDYSYDEKGRPKQVTVDFTVQKYSYGAESMKVSGAEGGTQNYTLDEQGRVKQLEVKNKVLNKLEYDNEGYLVRNVSPGGVQTFKYGGGDMLQEYDGNGELYAEYSYSNEVWDSRQNKPVLDYDINALFLGKGNRHMAAGIKFANGEYSVFKNTMDGRGRPAKISVQKFNARGQHVEYKQVDFLFTYGTLK